MFCSAKNVYKVMPPILQTQASPIFDSNLAARYHREVCSLDAPSHLENANEAVVEHKNDIGPGAR
jgi:hypothetical protein